MVVPKEHVSFFLLTPHVKFFTFLLYRCGRIIRRFTVHRMGRYNSSGSSTVPAGVSCERLRIEREGPWPMAWKIPVL